MLASKRLTLKLHQYTRNGRDLRKKLLDERRLAWIDVGSSEAEPEFICMNIVDQVNAGKHRIQGYIQGDILDRTGVESLGAKFDLVRMQHVLEHFSPEQVPEVLDNVCMLLKPGGIFLVTVPDLAVHVQAYLQNYRFGAWYRRYAKKRLDREPMAADTFSIYTHLLGHALPEVPGEAHKWCYDSASLRHWLTGCRGFSAIRHLGLLHPLSSVPFTHNRPTEDLCFIATRNTEAIRPQAAHAGQ